MSVVGKCDADLDLNCCIMNGVGGAGSPRASDDVIPILNRTGKSVLNGGIWSEAQGD